MARAFDPVVARGPTLAAVAVAALLQREPGRGVILAAAGKRSVT
jgi:hypothetical protein